jgi:hypothetical protein
MIGHTEYPGDMHISPRPFDMHISSWPFVPKKLRDTNRQDMVFIRPPESRCLSAEDGKHLIFQAFYPVQNQYKDRHQDAAG